MNASNLYVKGLLVLILSIGYAIIRYYYFGPVEAVNILSYLVNKGVSMAAVFFLLFSAYSRYKDDNLTAGYWGKTSLVFMTLHLLLSFPLWTAGYFESFYWTHDVINDKYVLLGKMNLKGEIALLTGAVGTIIWYMINSKKPKLITPLMILAATSVSLHVGVMGVMGWFNPGVWNGGLPPITLVSFLAAVPCFWFLLVKRSKK